MSDARQVGNAQNGQRLNRTDDGDRCSWFGPMLALLLAPLSAWCAPAVLDHSSLDPAALTAPPLPESVFHAWEHADPEAGRIISAWAEGDAVILPWAQLQLRRYVRNKMMPTRGARGLGLVLARHSPAEEGNEPSGLVEPSEPKPIVGTNAQNTTVAPPTIGQPTTAHAAHAQTNSDPDGRKAMETHTDAR